MIIDPLQMPNDLRYKLLTGTVVPRPIAWVSSMNKAGQLNLAPFSYFTIAATDPMTLLFCPQVPSSGPPRHKDTLLNVRAVPEFVINLTDETTAAQMNRTATELPHGQSEFEWANLTPAPSQTIGVPRVLEAPVAYECRLQQILTISDAPGGGAVVFGEVQCIHIRDDLYGESGRVSLEKLQAIGRVAGTGYVRTNNTFDMARVPLPKP
jgi:flavin reductase (DIM6/NTAB) family NADH-FMN oxidoreductase RutF